MGSECSGQAAEDAWRISHVSPWAPAKISQQTALSLSSSEEGGVGNSSVEKRAAWPAHIGTSGKAISPQMLPRPRGHSGVFSSIHATGNTNC